MKRGCHGYKLRCCLLVILLTPQKAKAEQKYFSTMKSKDTLQGENRALKQQLAKTAEVITKVQEAEKSLLQKIVRYYYHFTNV